MLPTANNSHGDNNAEKRHFRRIQLDSPVQIKQAGQTIQSTVVNISLKGVLIKDTDKALKHNINSQLSIHLGNNTDINMLARWDHSDRGCSGFHWIKLDIESMQHLRRLIELNNDDADELDRELGLLCRH